jgi:hypothetical protein
MSETLYVAILSSPAGLLCRWTNTTNYSFPLVIEESSNYEYKFKTLKFNLENQMNTYVQFL